MNGKLGSDELRPLAVCTIISHNYLSHARTLLRSFFQHEPDGHAYVLVVDRLPEGVELGIDARVIDPSELGLTNWQEFCFQYDATELCTAVKPRLLSLLMDQYGEEQVVYLDPDIVLFRPLDELKQVLPTTSLVLTPHTLAPIPQDGAKPSELNLLTTGAYNLGFIALNQSAQTRELLEWWDERLLDKCRVDWGNGLFVDQKWIDLAPSYFSETVILRDDTYNVAFWNLHERKLELRDNNWYVNGRPLTFFHFSGFVPTEPRILSKHQTRTEIEEGTALAALLDLYVARQMQNGYETFIQHEYGYARFDNGIRINPILRHLYLNLGSAARKEFGDPFVIDRTPSFFDWATQPEPGEFTLSPFLKSLYGGRMDLARAYPDVLGADKVAFIEWARLNGASEMGFEPDLVHPTSFDNSSPPPENDVPVNWSESSAWPEMSALWERERAMRALEQWAHELEAAILEKDKAIQMYERQLGWFSALSPARAALYLRNKVRQNRKRLGANSR